MKCKICGKEFESGRSMHGHMMRMHEEKYRLVGCDMTSLVEGYEKKVYVKAPTKPTGFRMLNLSNQQEANAYSEGYRYIDNESNCYEADEARQKGWI